MTNEPKASPTYRPPLTLEGRPVRLKSVKDAKRLLARISLLLQRAQISEGRAKANALVVQLFLKAEALAAILREKAPFDPTVYDMSIFTSNELEEIASGNIPSNSMLRKRLQKARGKIWRTQATYPLTTATERRSLNEFEKEKKKKRTGVNVSARKTTPDPSR